jgi:hypothetical protein
MSDEKKTTGSGTDYGQATADALNTWGPERTASYRKWLEHIGPKSWTPVAKADMAKMLAEEAIESVANAKLKET